MDNVNTLHKQLYDEYSLTVRSIASSRLFNKNLVGVVVEATFVAALHNIGELQTCPDHCEWLVNKALEIVERFNNQ
jgi:hypothetical protein